MVRRASDVSDAEMEVLQTLWKAGPGTVRDVGERLGPAKSQWAYTTIQTLLGRLEAKGFVDTDRNGLAHVFRAIVTREQFLADRLRELADKICDGTTMPLVMALVDNQPFTKEEVAEFRRLLDEGARSDKKPKTGRWRNRT